MNGDSSAWYFYRKFKRIIILMNIAHELRVNDLVAKNATRLSKNAKTAV